MDGVIELNEKEVAVVNDDFYYVFKRGGGDKKISKKILTSIFESVIKFSEARFKLGKKYDLFIE